MWTWLSLIHHLVQYPEGFYKWRWGEHPSPGQLFRLVNQWTALFDRRLCSGIWINARHKSIKCNKYFPQHEIHAHCACTSGTCGGECSSYIHHILMSPGILFPSTSEILAIQNFRKMTHSLIELTCTCLTYTHLTSGLGLANDLYVW